MGGPSSHESGISAGFSFSAFRKLRNNEHLTKGNNHADTMIIDAVDVASLSQLSRQAQNNYMYLHSDQNYSLLILNQITPPELIYQISP